MRQESERHAENVDVLWIEQACVRVGLIGGPTQAASDDLLAEQLAGEGSQAHDVGHGFRIPTLGQHPYGNHLLYLLAGFPNLPHGVHLQAESLGLLLFGQVAFLAVV